MVSYVHDLPSSVVALKLTARLRCARKCVCECARRGNDAYCAVAASLASNSYDVNDTAARHQTLPRRSIALRFNAHAALLQVCVRVRQRTERLCRARAAQKRDELA